MSALGGFSPNFLLWERNKPLLSEASMTSRQVCVAGQTQAWFMPPCGRKDASRRPEFSLWLGPHLFTVRPQANHPVLLGIRRRLSPKAPGEYPSLPLPVSAGCQQSWCPWLTGASFQSPPPSSWCSPYGSLSTFTKTPVRLGPTPIQYDLMLI